MTGRDAEYVIDAESVVIRPLAGEWEIMIERPDCEDLVIYKELPDAIYEQLVESGDIEP